ncbi:MAG: O-antigen ligase family protein [Anaerolineae bacterium]
MRTRLSVFCEAVIEAGWLLAALVAPLFFDVYSQRVFEPDKIGLVRSIATIMAAVWAIWLLERLATAARKDRAPTASWWDRIRKTRLVLPALLLVVAYLISTALSVTPRISFWGSYERLQGTYSLLSYVVIGLSVLFLLRRREQVERLLLVLVLSSIPVALYGVVQHYGLDPLPWGGDVTQRVAGNLGNAIFIAAYLIMVVPITVVQWIRLWHRETASWARMRRLGIGAAMVALAAGLVALWGMVGLGAGLWFAVVVWGVAGVIGWLTGGSVRRWLMLGFYASVLAVQLVCIIFTQSRGPWLGLLGGMFLFLIAALVASRRHRMALAVGVGALLVGAFLGVLNVPGGPLAPLRDLPYLGRLGRVFEVQTGTGRVRVLIWEGALEMVTDSPLRAAVGYGPESMYSAFSPYYSPELAHLERRSASPDRSHNETYDVLITTGVLGFAAYMYLFLSVYLIAMQALGLVRDRRDRWLFVGLTLGGGMVGAVLPYLVEGQWRYAGITMPLAVTTGMGAYALVKAVMGWAASGAMAPTNETRPWSEQSLLVAGLLGAILAHFVEIHFGIAIGATRTYFWILSAALVVVGEGWVVWDEPAAVLAQQTRSSRRRKARRQQSGEPLASRIIIYQAVAIGLIGAAILGTLAWDYTANAIGETSPMTMLWQSLTTMQARGDPDTTSLGVAAVVASTWVALGLMVAGLEIPGWRSMDWRERARAGLIAMGVAGLIAGIYALLHAHQLCPPVDVTALLMRYVALLVIVWLTGAVAMALSSGWQVAARGGGVGLVGLVLVMAAIPIVEARNLRPIRADMIFKQGMRLEREGSLTMALSQYGQAAQLAPAEDRYWLYQGRVALEQARVETDASERERYLNMAQQALQTARSLNPLNTDHAANLARLHRVWGELETTEAARQAHWERAEAYYAEAHALSPNSAQILNEWGLLLLLLGEKEAGLAKLDESLALDDAYAQTYMLLGDYYVRQQEWEAAVEAYRQATAMDTELLQVWSGLGYAASQMGDWETSLDANLEVYRRAPKDYNTVKNLAIIQAQMGNDEEALAKAHEALELAPEAERPALERFIGEVEARMANEGDE